MWQVAQSYIAVAPRKKRETNDEVGEELLERLVMNTTNDESVDWNQWYKVAQTIFNVGGSEALFLRWSALSPKHDEKAALTLWAGLKRKQEGELTIASLYHWSSKNPEEHKRILADFKTRPDFWSLIEQLNNHSTAEFFYSIYPDAYLFSETIGWFSLGENNIWKSYDKAVPHGLLSNIAKTFQNLANNARNSEFLSYERQTKETNDKDALAKLESEHKCRLSKLSFSFNKFGTKDFCNGVIAFLSSFYNDEALEEKMDKNGKLLAFTNGVYDLETLVFRPIVPKDYISTTTGYEFDKSSNPEVRKEIEGLFYSFFEDKQTSNYLLSILASCLLGANRWQEFYVLTGTGGNGKSLLTLLLKKVFGGYYLSVDSSLITKPVERRDQPIPALVEARTCRIMVTAEPEASDKLQVGLLKKITGGDIIEARTLNSKHIVKYTAMFKPLILANDIPALNKIDGGVQRRMKVLKFPFAFKRQSEVVADFHRVADPDLEKKTQSMEWRDEMMLMLLETYASIRNLKASPTCPAVEEQSKEYLDENNPLKEWLSEHFIIGGDKGIQPRELKSYYLSDTGTENIDDKRFKQLLGFNGIYSKKSDGRMKYMGLVRKETGAGTGEE
jgi:P4 family phage/plasmid primase-like protien